MFQILLAYQYLLMLNTARKEILLKADMTQSSENLSNKRQRRSSYEQKRRQWQKKKQANKQNNKKAHSNISVPLAILG